MSTQISTHTGTGHNNTLPLMRLVNTADRALPKRTIPSSSPNVEINDPRWVFAMRARLSIEYQILDEETVARLISQAKAIGLNQMQARAIIGIVEDATVRGGMDSIAHKQLMDVPATESSDHEGMTDRARWLTFGVLFAWALLIAGVMQIAS